MDAEKRIEGPVQFDRQDYPGHYLLSDIYREVFFIDPIENYDYDEDYEIDDCFWKKDEEIGQIFCNTDYTDHELRLLAKIDEVLN